MADSSKSEHDGADGPPVADPPGQSETDVATPERRRFLATIGKVAMVGGLAASYGTCAAFSGRFLYPAGSRPSGWQFVIQAERMSVGDAITYRAPGGAPISIARQGGRGGLADFIALSQTCPHLGCQVHWEPHNDRFFCPCHNGVFTPDGKAVSGPPAEAGQDLPRYPLKIEGGLPYADVPLTALSRAAAPATEPRGADMARCRELTPEPEQT